MAQKITLQQAEQKLHDAFYGKYVKFVYPGYNPVYGKVDQISIDTVGDPEIAMQINGKRYTCSPEALKDCLTLLTNNYGDHSGTEDGDAGRIQEDN